MSVLSSVQASEILRAAMGRLDGIEVSLDLGRSKSLVSLNETKVKFPDGQELSLALIKKIIGDTDTCFLVEDNELKKIFFFSKDTNKTYKLRATGSWPALEISGILMHRIKNTNPEEDARAKIEAVGPLKGIVLDTCMGLGYSAITASKTAERVITFEKDSNVVELARYNPYSQDLFSNKRIEIIEGDVFEQIKNFDGRYFDFIIHDPPRFSLAGELYSGDFYSELYRVLKKGGRVFHYVGDPGGKYRKKDFATGVAKRLMEAGFGGLRKDYRTEGLVAIRES
ncbi:MAG: methyltransferase domain-containing protein [Candidatus Altiarchaeota archaeon]|nr:methyltransferase domain-containing protein [Candidatus Altiarchaeota archaeon]